MNKRFITKNYKETQKLGELIGKNIISDKRLLSDTVILELIGNLGGGKTTFLQGFAKGLGIKNKILSPTFIIMKSFEIPSPNPRAKKHTFYHIDCYRIGSFRDAKALGLEKILFSSGNIVAIEWSEKIKEILPQKTIKIRFHFVDQKTRKINLNIPYTIRL